MNLETLWESVLAEMELQISKPNFLTWLKNSRLAENREGEARVALPNNFAREWVETKYHKLILGILRTNNPSIKKVEYFVDSMAAGEKREKSGKKQEDHSSPVRETIGELKIDQESGLNPKYSFNSFIVGSSNELAYAAALAIVDEVGRRYNPFFVYGGVGLGKTHLIQAIGNEIRSRYEGRVRVKYVSSEKFTNDVIWAIRNKRVEDIKNTYRTTDVLIIDDIQFIGGKEKTEEEFFHTFNALHENSKQIIISSDRPPRSLPVLEERLRSRFEGGMIADISYPDFETRVAIINMKLQERKEELVDEIVHLVARKLQRNIREIEGVLNKILFHKSQRPDSFGIEQAEKILHSIAEQVAPNVTPTQILKAVAAFYEIAPNDLVGRGRKKEIIEPRQVAIYLLRDMLNMSYPYIAEKVGKRDHTTAIYAYEKITQSIPLNHQLNQRITTIKDLVNKV